MNPHQPPSFRLRPTAQPLLALCLALATQPFAPTLALAQPKPGSITAQVQAQVQAPQNDDDAASPGAVTAQGITPAREYNPTSVNTKSRAPVTLNFVNADIEAVSRAIGAMLDRQVLVDPRVKGVMTVTSDKAQPPLDAYRSYLAALRGLGFTVVESAGLLKVVPEAEAKLQTGVVSVGAPSQRGDQILTQIFKLNYENPNNLVAVLRPLITANNTINANPASGTLVITDYADNLQRLGKIITALDQPTETDVEVYPIKNALAADLAPLVQRLAEGGATAPTPGAPGGASSGTSVLADSRSNSLIVRTNSVARMAVVKLMIEKLDRPVQGGGPAGNIWVVYLKNADATRLAEVLRAAVAGGSSGGGGGGSSSSGGGSASTSLGALSNTTAGGTAGASSAGGSASSTTNSPQATTPVQSAARPSTGGMVQADPATNSLIITAPEAVYRQMRTVIDELDSRRAQVFIESMIVEMDAQKAADFGFQWQNLFGNSGSNNLYGAGTNFGTGSSNILTLTGAAAGGTASLTTQVSGSPISNGFNFVFAKKFGSFYTLGALANFLQTNTDSNILSTPNLIALDNEEAKIVVGQNVPFVTGSYTNTGASNGSTNPFQTVERQDVGLTLRIKPQIGENGTVRLTIFQENSSVVASTSNSLNGPTTNKSSIETTVVADDGQIIVLGGLLKDQYEGGQNKVPGVGDVPLFGNLFKSESRTRTKSNLMVFLRPVIIRTSGEVDSTSIGRYEAIRALQATNQTAPTTLLPVGSGVILPPAQPGQSVPVSEPSVIPPKVPEPAITLPVGKNPPGVPQSP
jgi:general secretion pathway protein D